MSEMSLEDWREQDKARKAAAGILPPSPPTIWSEYKGWIMAIAFVVCIYYSV